MQLERINIILSILLITTGIVVGSCFLLVSVSKNKDSQNYRIARILMGIAYLLLAVSLISRFVLPHNFRPDINPERIIILMISPLMVLSLTYSSLSLINNRFSIKQKLVIEIVPVFVFSCWIWIAYFTSPSRMLYISQGVFIIYYIFILFKHAFIFHKTFKKFKIKDLSEQDRKRLKHINFLFRYALSMGILALVSILSPHIIFMIFKAFVILFCIHYGFMLIHYGFKYQSVEINPIASIEDSGNNNDMSEPKTKIVGTRILDNNINIHTVSYNDLEFLIGQWIEQKHYLNAGVTIEQLANELNTNRTYISHYINTNKKQTFREWINQLCIDEAKQLMLKNPTLPISEVGKMVGFNDKSNFTRQFTKVTGMSPSFWKNSN